MNSGNNICKAHKNNFEPNIRCPRETKVNEDFCRYHIRYKKYMTNLTPTQDEINKNLDNTQIETLLDIYDSWREVPEIYRIKLEKWWDIRILCQLFANQLCTSDMTNPKPNYPFNPFNRILFTPDELSLIKKKIIELKLPIYIGLAEFLSCDYKKIYENKKKSNNEHKDYKCMIQIINILEKKLKFRLLNCKNSQDCYTGFWVYKKDKRSEFEQLLYLYDNTSTHTITQVNNEVTNTIDIVILYNPKKDFLLNKINKYQKEDFELLQNSYLTIIT
jgi:hypothetical protein